MVERVILQGAHQLDIAALASIVSAGGSVLVLSGRQSKFLAIVHGEAHADASIRLRQYRLASGERLALTLASRIVGAKINAQRTTLLRMLQGRPDLLHSCFRPLQTMRDSINSLSAPEPPPYAALLGIEGASARTYFHALAAAFAPALGFSGRNRRPPRDPVNATLSLAYTLLFSEAITAAYRAGLDPALGHYHRPAFGRMSLACDLIEPLRPHVDYWVWTLFRDRVVRSEDFQFDKSACRMSKPARGRFYLAYESFAASARRQLRRYCSLLVRQLRTLNTCEQENAIGTDWDCDVLDELDSISHGPSDNSAMP